ncbi:MAG: hydantoinase/oxoprolinase family protein [Alphaproteobacteria bacterium]|nr:hydantoinase/oxoprolinase family protein [Alphaproteobacteria bacterium]MBU0805362.1 hydantoinase/oxoprolinase family protein [Alphaproteobacteria bacterium]MBU0873308.1 hydantoinase/oxoprolinase family protein [Alphaproteobacteria bacterium]MBU1401464.1 hydantoinase/oxoprolinase family protein [Alphaproteobacteria bacterium]MBU1592119.1 hydantoinase/oxoprolinase family protein [Alphaproteobacteria bacterium]
MRVGVEVGGTFTDLVAVEDGHIVLTKVPSTPHSPDIGVMNAIDHASVNLSKVEDLVHGSTVATNALLERKGARVAFITTKGFRDILHLQRHDRLNIYDLRYQRPVPVVERRDCFEVSERVDGHGTIIEALNTQAEVDRLVPALQAGAYEAIGICLLSSYVNPDHERAIQSALEAHLPGVFITCSSDVSREFREFERASTTTLAAYVQPVIDAYLNRLEKKLGKLGFKDRFSVMQSNGGRLPVGGMRRNAISALFSGPAAGVVGATRQAMRSEVGNIITFDMGGTSTDVCLVTDGRPSLSPDTILDGLPVRTPVLDIATIGAGGGSLIWIDDGGMLRVGPRSSGAMPGPACYGRGGTLPTITDAHVICGTIRPEAFLGGTMAILPERSVEAFEPLAKKLGMTVAQAANASLRLAAANIVRAIQLVSTEKGHDPRDYSLVPFGGAGPLMAVEIADDLGLAQVLVPPNAGVLSAYGLIASDFAKIYTMTRRTAVDDAAPDVVRDTFVAMVAEAEADFESYELDGDLSYTFGADMRFVGQAFEISVDIQAGALKTLSRKDLIDGFIAAHHRVYMHGASAAQAIEIVGFRLEATRKIDSLPLLKERALTDRPAHQKSVMQGSDGPYDVDVLTASSLEIGSEIAGPALIEGYSTSTFVPAGWFAVRQENDNLILRKKA